MTIGFSLIGALGSAGSANTSGGGTLYPIEANNGDLYWVYIDNNSDVVFVKSTDGGETWAAPVTVFTGTATALSVWFDRWSNISAGLIHCTYIESVGDETLYRSIDTENSDTLGTETSMFNGSSTASGGALSIVRARGGNIYVKTMIDAGAEGGRCGRELDRKDRQRGTSHNGSVDFDAGLGGRQSRHYDVLLGRGCG
jgi:hypothetical protein